MAKRWIEILLNLIFWVFTAWVITHNFSIIQIERFIENDQETFKVIRSNELVIKLLMCTIISLLMFYINLYLFISRDKDKPLFRVAFQSFGVLVISVGLPFLLMLIEILPESPKVQPSVYWGISIFYFSISVAYGIGKAWINTEILRKNLQVEKKQAELNLLRAQLHPHFLFNTLNNLLSMVDQHKNPKLASAIDKLSGLLRYVVYENLDSKVTIQQEINFIKNYAELQMLRFEDNEIQFTLSIKGEYNQQLIESGIFVPFVENAFKHGTWPEHQSYININFDLTKPNVVAFSVRNPKTVFSKDESKSGTGILATQQRLQLIYPKKHILSLYNNETFIVELKLVTDESTYS